MCDAILQNKGCIRFKVNAELQQPEWTQALLKFHSENDGYKVSARLKDIDYECVDANETQIHIPIKHFGQCKKRTELSKPRDPRSARILDELIKGTGVPIFQIRLTSQKLFFRKHLWIGFDNRLHQDLWFATLKPLMTRGFRRTSREMRQTENLDTKLQSEVCLFAAALPNLLDNEVYERASADDLYNVLVLETEASRQLALFGRYHLRISLAAFELLYPHRGTVACSWPLKFIRKFGVHRNRLYLLTGSSCEGGTGLLVFAVQQAASLEHRLLELARSASNSCNLPRKTQIQFFQLDNEFKEPGNHTVPTSLTGSIDGFSLGMEHFKKESSTTTEEHVTAAQIIKHRRNALLPTVDVALQVTLEHSEARGGAKCMLLSPNFSDNFNNENSAADLTNLSSSSEDELPECDGITNEPRVYANTLDIDVDSDRFENKVALSDTGRSSIEQNSDCDCPNSDRIPSQPRRRPWRLRCSFAPIKEIDEKSAPNNSQHLEQNCTENFGIVTSSTQEEDLVFGDLLDDDDVEQYGKSNLVSDQTRTSSSLSKSATWNGHGDKEFLHRKHRDATVQTLEEENDLMNNLSITVETKL